jgi:hypothetical protein
MSCDTHVAWNTRYDVKKAETTKSRIRAGGRNIEKYKEFDLSPLKARISGCRSTIRTSTKRI